jgi:anti-sigma regulatory factor (Ser/Thr protein kinase)
MICVIAKEVASTDELFAFIEQFVQSEAVDDQTAFQLTVAAEELFTNLVKYSTRSRRPVSIRLEQHQGWLEMQMTDFDSDEFDITTAQLPDLDVPIAQRRAGGMGLHLVRSFANELSYRHEDGNSIITFRKRREDPNVRGTA